MDRRAKIVATIGPASQDEWTIRQLIQAGVDIMRLNFSHGTHQNHEKIFRTIRDLSREMGKPITILQDLQGPKIRVGLLATDKVNLSAGQEISLTTQPILGDENKIPIDFPQITQFVEQGSRILLDDGNLELAATRVEETEIDCEVIIGGELRPHKGVNLPDTRLDIPGFTDKDATDLEFGIQIGVDAVAISFVRSAKDINMVRGAINSIDLRPIKMPIIAKLERPEAIENLAEIVDATDGVMVARGDLGVEISPERVPIIQKRIIETANCQGKLVITATQMLDSMIHNPRPTRAEASDVANAILDGTDAVMLSGETASGRYPVEAVEMMNAIICQAETNMAEWGHWSGEVFAGVENDDTYYMTRAARELGHDKNVSAIAVFTESGRTALMMSKARPQIPILAFTPNPITYQRLNLLWGVHPYLVTYVDTIKDMIKAVENAMLKESPIQPGQQVVLICGYPLNTVRPTNLALLHTVGSQ